MAFAFADEVEVTTTKLQIGTKTLLTRVGGVIGVGKEFLWIILCGLSGIKLIATILKTKTTNANKECLSNIGTL